MGRYSDIPFPDKVDRVMYFWGQFKYLLESDLGSGKSIYCVVFLWPGHSLLQVYCLDLMFFVVYKLFHCFQFCEGGTGHLDDINID